MKMCPRQSRGFTLIQVMVAIGVTTVAILGLLQMMNLSNKAQKGFEAHTDFHDLVFTVRQLLDSEMICALNFAGLEFDYINKNEPKTDFEVELYLPDREGKRGELIAKPGMKHKSGFTIKQMDLKVASPLAFGKYLGKLTLMAEKNKVNGVSTSLGAPIMTKELTFVMGSQLKNPTVKTSSVEVVNGCYGERSYTQICSDLGGTYDPEYEHKCNLTNHICGAMGMKVAPNGKQCTVAQNQLQNAMKDLQKLFKGLSGGQRRPSGR